VLTDFNQLSSTRKKRLHFTSASPYPRYENDLVIQITMLSGALLLAKVCALLSGLLVLQ